MANLRNFINAIANDNRIYTAEDIGKMTNKEFMANEKAIDYQMANLGIPRESELTGNPDVVYVHAYTRDDGTEVRAHYLPSLMGVAGMVLYMIKTADLANDYPIRLSCVLK